ERAVTAAAERVNRPRHQFLAGAVLAVDEHPAVCRSGHRDLLAELPYRIAFAHHRLVTIDAGAEGEVFDFQTALTQGIAHDQHGFFQRQRLFDEVEGAELDRANRRFDVAVTRDQHNLRVDLPFTKASER